MSNELILHLGTPKTGTTSIQRFLSSNKKMLRTNGIVYPESLIDNSHHTESLILARLFKPDQSFDWSSRINEVAEKYRGKEIEIIENIKAEFDSLKMENKKLILSAETFFKLFNTEHKIKMLLKFFPDFKIKAIVYLRRVDRQLESAAKQGLKQRKISFNYLRKRKKNIARQQYMILPALESWSTCIGKENLVVRPFEYEQLESSDVVMDFLKHAGLNEIKYHKDSFQLNSSVPIELLEFFHSIKVRYHLDYTFFPQKIALSLCERLKEKGYSFHSYSIFSPKVRRRLILEFQSIYNRIAQEYTSDDNGFFKEPIPKRNEKWKVYNRLKRKDIESFLSELLKGEIFP
ncbi:MAG: hypothetical protein PQJ59_02985 [Spirochaetales bacterium]|nr:hypothetical protein [Spirochaetales bacterium]